MPGCVIQTEEDQRSYPSIDLVMERLRQLNFEYNRLERPMIVNVLDAAGNTISLGLGNALGSCLLFTSADPSIGDVHAAGDPDRDGLEVFSYLGDHTEIERADLIPTAAALKAMEEILRDGGLPRWIRWEGD